MKLQLDTSAKTIKVEENVNLKELFELLDRLLPNGEWKEYKLESGTVINWGNPIIIRERQPYLYPQWQNPFWYGTTMLCDSQDNCHITTKEHQPPFITPTVFNIQA